jgi:hypothetical protein
MDSSSASDPLESKVMQSKIGAHAEKPVHLLDRSFKRMHESMVNLRIYQKVLDKAGFWEDKERCSYDEFFTYAPPFLEARISSASSPLGKNVVVQDALEFYKSKAVQTVRYHARNN